ncbi:MAG TPA: gliding motility-associated ABC transporter substrate-binding protein GldG [Bacteroidales bacterium]|nr:gliding motility-associated ABC transporter substrate-binding protein GldG [Bacteroidales bacterium]
MKKVHKDIRRHHLIQVGLTLLIVILLWVIGSKVYFRIDLTSEKRFTLTQETKTILKHLPDEIYVKVYLEGDLPAAFKKLRNSVKETLDEFRVHAGQNIQYEFINPAENPDVKARSQLYADLYNKGLRPTNIMIRGEEGTDSKKLIFPSALVSYNGVEIPVNFLKNNVGLSAEENLNNSMQTIEYELIKPIHNLTSKKIDKVAFIEGHGELNEFEVEDIYKEIANSFDIYRGAIGGKPAILNDYKAIVIARPMKEFNEADKLVLDQYIMKGGRVLWVLDEVNANADSLVNGSTFAFVNNTNLDDMLFTYGARINPSLVQDIQCNVIPINTAVRGMQAKFDPMPWLYYPLLGPQIDHPISRSLNMVLARFPSSIDTVGANGKIRKTPLLITSPYTRLVNVPAMISLEEVRKTPTRNEMSGGQKTIAVLLEGKFASVFRNRQPSAIIPGYPGDVIKESTPNRMIVVACGDMIRNDVRMTADGPVAAQLGYDRYTRQTFGNKDFLMNCIQYLTDDAGLMELRNKNFKLRLLDKQKVREEKVKWQLINTILPSVIVILFGIYYNYRRRIKYTK